MWIHNRLRSILTFAAPLLFTREQPQEMSHDKYLRKVNAMLWLDNTINATDPVFGLLVDTSAEGGNGFVSDITCLQMAIADVAYTNAKKIGDTEGMIASLIYRTLERNTNGVGIRSGLCTSMRPVNPEIAALEQHQDPASDGAVDHNRAVVLELARQIALIGGNAMRATDAGTFAPGTICDQPDCIYDGRLQVLVTNDEIASYVNQCVATITVSQTAPPTRPTQTSPRPSVPPPTPSQSGNPVPLGTTDASKYTDRVPPPGPPSSPQ